MRVLVVLAGVKFPQYAFTGAKDMNIETLDLDIIG
jgi:hypothetical protein